MCLGDINISLVILKEFLWVEGYFVVKLGFRFSRNAAMPSFWSWVENPVENEEISRVQAEGRSMLTPVFTSVLMHCVCIPDFVAIFWASRSVSSMSFSGSRILLTRPMRKASCASMVSPVRRSSFALMVPTSRGSRCVPPKPGWMPRLISGCPIFARVEAMMMSQAIMTSQPPPSAYPFTAAIYGSREFSML